MTRPTVLALASLKPSEMNAKLHADYTVVQNIAQAQDARIVLTSGSAGLTQAQMSQLPALELIAVNGVGVDAVDLTEAHRRGIAVTTTPDVLSTAVAEMALGLALTVGRRITEGDRFIRGGHWVTGGKPTLGRSVIEGRAGILGYGRIGRQLAELLRGLGIQVFYTARSEKPEARGTYVADSVVLARECDVLFVTAAGGDASRHLVDASVLVFRV